MDIGALEHCRYEVDLPSGKLSYLDTHSAVTSETQVPALFVHGVGMNAYLWGEAIERLSQQKRCIAIDLPLHGHSPCDDDQDLSLLGIAKLLEEFCVQLNLPFVDLVGNNSGGAMAQTLAVYKPELIRSLTLTNCDVHSNLPPESFKQTIQLAQLGKLWETTQQLYSNPEMLQVASEVAKGYEFPQRVSIEKYRNFLDPVLSDETRCKMFEKMLLSLRAEDLMALEPKLQQLDRPVLLVWGTDDVFFDLCWAKWLAERLPRVWSLVELDGAKLFFPDERPEEFVKPLQAFWQELDHSPLV